MAPYSVQQLPEQDRPRERLLSQGPEALTTSELLAIVLGSGTRERPVLQLAQDIVSVFGSLQRLSEATVEELQQIKGLGAAKAVLLKAVFALGSKLAQQEYCPKYRIETPKQAYNLIREELEGQSREHFVAILQDTKGSVIRRETISIGTLSQTLVHPREVFYPAIRHKAASLIVAHNHPSGDPTPSAEDIRITEALIDAGRLIDIPLNDHLIVGTDSYVSLRERGLNFSGGR